MRIFYLSFITLLLLLAASGVSQAAPLTAQAAAADKVSDVADKVSDVADKAQSISLTIDPLPIIHRGERVTVNARATTSAGLPLPDLPLVLFWDKNLLHRARTDADGLADFRTEPNLPDGDYVLQLVFKGNANWRPAIAIGKFSVQPALTPLISLQPLPAFHYGEWITATVQVSASAGVALAGVPMELRLDDQLVAHGPTSATGVFTAVLANKLTVGIHPLQAQVAAIPSLVAVRATTAITIVPMTVEMSIIPPIAGIQVELAGQISESDSAGLVRLTIPKPDIYQLRILTEAVERDGMRAHFYRWRSDDYGPNYELFLPQAEPVQAGYNLSYQVHQRFVDADGAPVAAELIDSFTLRGTNGANLELKSGEAQWFDAVRVVRRIRGLEAGKIQYSVQSVMIDGTNVVNQGQQKYFVNQPNDEWQIGLIFHPARFKARDALLGFGLGNGINLEYPNGEILYHAANEAGEVVLNTLARGAYKVQAANVPGFSTAVPVAISRAQSVDLLVISYLDIGLAVGAGLVVVIALILLGRPHLRRKFTRGSSQAITIEQPQLTIDTATPAMVYAPPTSVLMTDNSAWY